MTETSLAAASDAPAEWVPVCGTDDLIPNAGVCALVAGREVAIFYLPDAQPSLYAIDNHDPIGGANVLYRGIVGDLGGRLVVASPLYKQHFDLACGECLEEPERSVSVYPVRLSGDQVELGSPCSISHT